MLTKKFLAMYDSCYLKPGFKQNMKKKEERATNYFYRLQTHNNKNKSQARNKNMKTRRMTTTTTMMTSPSEVDTS